ncbi:extracellular solute-binding protein [Natroniella sulfidigena]|uniref:ABC transporter substrate-binding protein n=1 Tax=Natroniella sulfidigena TaxID=723921 RepID=UPI00200A16AD|nr:extracellular solute-binding protein [Natroniella sulfidigena]MCK8817286.1 extracellular solute-binding protein [Natroniella sulfidigena]
MWEKLKFNLSWAVIIAIMLLITVISGTVTLFVKFRTESEFSIDPTIELAPNQVYQITYWDYPLFFGLEDDYQEFLEGAIKEFNKFYPNIEVTYELLSFSEGEAKLKNALAEDRGPDLYHDIFGAKLISQELQLPVSPFLNLEDEAGAKELDDYDPLALQALSGKEEIWGLPTWLVPQVWVGNKELLAQTDLELNKVVGEGWSWQELIEVSQRLVEEDKDIIFNPHNPELFYQLLITAGKGEWLSAEGELLLTEKDLTKAFQFLEELRASDAFPREEKRMNEKLLPYFWENQAAIIAPVNLWLLNNLYQRELKEGVELTLLPPPSPSKLGKESVPVEIKSLLLFRQEEYQGDDHTKAVYKFAQFITQRKNQFLAQKLNVMPAYLPLQEEWSTEVRLKEELKVQLLDYLQRGTSQEIDSFIKFDLEKGFKEIIEQGYYNFWFEDRAISEIVTEMMVAFERIIAESEQRMSEN